MTPQQTAERCAEIMWPDDHAARGLGIEIVAVAPGEWRRIWGAYQRRRQVARPA